MRKRARIALIIGSLALVASGRAQEAVKLSDMSDDLQRIQIRMAQGDKAAYAAQQKQLRAMGAVVASAKPETWKGSRETDALVIYVLSGGALGDVVPLLKTDALPELARTLARGAFAYITNHEADARDLLSRVDLSALEPRLGGQIAFARSVLETRRDPKAAAMFLDWARLVAPGGLVEEAALRREIALVAEARDASRAAMLTRQYATRFAASLYAADFFGELARLIARLGLADDPANYQLLSDAAASLSPDVRRDFLLTLAKAAIVNARFESAAAAASEALRNTPANSADEARGHFYLDASRLFSDGYDAARADLQAIPPSKLDRSDAALLASVRGVAAQLRIAPSAGAVEGQGAQPGESQKAAGPTQTIGLAEEALKRTEGEAAAAGQGGAP